MSILHDKKVPLTIFVFTFLISCFANSFDLPILPTLYKGLNDWVLVMTTFSLGTGVISLVLYHSNRIAKKQKRYYLSFVTLVTVVVMAVGCFYIETRSILYGTLYAGLATAILGFTSFTQYTALFRAFRVRNIEALIFTICAGFAIMLYAPIFETVAPITAQIGIWIMDIPSSGANKGIILGIAIGTIALAIRSLTGKETSYMAGS